MPGFVTEVPHQLGQAAAVEKLKGFLDQVKQRYSKEISEVEGSWSENVLRYALTTYGIKDFEVAYFDTDAHHDRKFNWRHVALQGKMKESGRAKNPNTGNTIVMYTSPTKKSSYRPVELPLSTPYQNPSMPSWLTL